LDDDCPRESSRRATLAEGTDWSTDMSADMSDGGIGLVGLAVMGQNLVLNMERHGYAVAVYNRSQDKTHAFIDGPARDKRITPTPDLGALVAALAKPRTVMLMVKAGAPVDAVIDQLAHLLEPGDLIIDGGNSLYTDTQRRAGRLEAQGLGYLGMGVSGGEEGALNGPSLMPGGTRELYARVEPLLRAIAAEAKGEACVSYIGPGGAGHFVKMVHNGIEYGDMQLIAEAYDLLSRGVGLSAGELAEVFTRFNAGPLASYLIEISAQVFDKVDAETGRPLVDVILDKAGQKGTGRWTVQAAMELGVAIPTITAAVEARSLSAAKAERQRAADVLTGTGVGFHGDRDEFIGLVEQALYAAKVASYAQGFALLEAAGREYQYGLDLGEIARIWRGGCIIRADFLDDIRAAYAEQPDLPNLLLAPFFTQGLVERQAAWRLVVQAAVEMGLPVPALAASLSYYDGYRSARLPANLIQGMRDLFGAHTFERIDRDGVFHADWSED